MPHARISALRSRGRVRRRRSVLGCGGVPTGSGRDELRDFADDYDKAMAYQAELPSKARTIDDIKQIARARRIVGACVPGKGGVYTHEWYERHKLVELSTLDGTRTVEDMAAQCGHALKKLAGRTIEACGARYVQLERHLSDDDSWTETARHEGVGRLVHDAVRSRAGVVDEGAEGVGGDRPRRV